VSDAAKTARMSNHATVSIGRAHHTRRDDRNERGGGGGRGTLEGAVMPSLLLMAAMTVSEVTTRIAIVGIVSLAGLMLVARLQWHPTRTRRASAVWRFGSSQVTTDVVRQRSEARQDVSRATRTGFLIAIAVTTGVALGVALSVVFVGLLNSSGAGAA